MSMLVAVIWAIPHAVRACSCARSPDPRVALDQADAVFLARVVEEPSRTQRIAGEVTYGFDVMRQWKGDPAPRVTIKTQSSSAACGRRFRMAKTYLVYATREGTGRYSDNLCSRTRELDQADDDLKLLGPGSPVRVEPEVDGDNDREPPFLAPPPPDLALPKSAEPGKRGCDVASGGGPRAPLSLLWLALIGGLRAARSRTSRSPASRP
ncbi:MAG: hypothetical protein KC636_31850 [Myxococcales bacterium]|nr:hypothetical protein [Myxococcales bacterium]